MRENNERCVQRSTEYNKKTSVQVLHQCATSRLKRTLWEFIESCEQQKGVCETSEKPTNTSGHVIQNPLHC